MDRRCAFYWFDLNNGAVRNRLQFYELLSVMQGEANDRLLCDLAAARHGDIPPVLDVGVARIHGSKHGAPGIGAYDLVEALFLPQFSLKSAQESVSSSAAAAQYNRKNARQRACAAFAKWKAKHRHLQQILQCPVRVEQLDTLFKAASSCCNGGTITCNTLL